jgi:hypothetical protein
MPKLNWCGTRAAKRKAKDVPKLEHKPKHNEEMRSELELVCSRILGLYLNAELIKDRTKQPLDELLQEGIDRALIAASELDKKYKFGLF